MLYEIIKINVYFKGWQVITLFCRKFEYCLIYAFFVQILLPKSVIVLTITLFACL